MNISAVAYNGDQIMVFNGPLNTVLSNLLAVSNDGFEVRRLDGTPIAGVMLSLDPRLPATVEEFDAQYPDAPHWSVVETQA